MKLLRRSLTDSLLRLLPRSVIRYVLNKVWLRPRIQDAWRFHIQPYRWDSAIPTRFDLRLEDLDRPRNLPGIRIDTDRCIGFLDRMAPYAQELRGLPENEQPGAGFWFKNGYYEDFDAASLYCMVRSLKPKRIVEAGSGFSSRIISMAARKNREEGSPVRCIFIEPFLDGGARRRLSTKLEGELLEKRVEDMPLSFFKELQAGDLLFFDTSHIIKAQSDCCYEQLQIIPSLTAGCYVHVHDVFTPYDYSEEWLLDKQRPYNEQYGLECLLSENGRMEVVMPLYMLWKERREALSRLLPSGTAPPRAFWVKRT